MGWAVISEVERVNLLATRTSWGTQGETKVLILCNPQWGFAEAHKALFICLWSLQASLV
jgi:hypothetical protein